jgi:protocatechuate 3,4-dioxygenase beta subunit
MRSAVLALLLATPTLALAQSTPRPEDLGTVTGHILCADTQRPARLAQVRLVAVDTAAGSKDTKSGKEDFSAFGNLLPAVQTDLTGGYIIRNVHPGQYYLRVDLPGYIDPLLSFTRDELAKPTPEIQQRMQRELQLVTVAPHSTLTADASLRRAASIAGSVTFDDGTPAIGVMIRILRRDPKGEFKENVRTGGMIWAEPVDDHGHYRFNSLPPGEYAVEADLTLSTQETSTMQMPGGQTTELVMTKFLFSLPVFSGSVIRRHNATPIKLDAGQEASDVDITIPISQLHEVSGTLLAKDGHAINGGKVALLFADDRSQFADVDINTDDATFRFPYVPEGNYILAVKEAKDVGHVEVPNPPGSNPRTHTDHPTLHTYGTTEQPLAVQTDLQSLNITVPDQISSAAPTTSSE